MTFHDHLSRGANGRPVLPGAACLPPMVQMSRVESKHALPPVDKPTAKQAKQNTSDRFGVLNSFVDCSLAGLTKAELATWLCLYRDTRNGTASTAQSDIAKRAGLSVRAINKAIRKLIEVGLIVVVFHGGLNRGPSRYRVASLRNGTS